jgi:hypothetical protein
MVIEYDADFYEEKFETASDAKQHVLDEDYPNWKVTKREYNGKSYILTMEHMWM